MQQKGFLYNGIHCSSFGCYYLPGAEGRWWQTPDFDVYDQNVSWHEGGYYYGNSAKPRTFEFDCYYEDVTRYTIQKIKTWLGKSTSGKLIMDDRPYVYYNVRPTKVVSGTVYNDSQIDGEVHYSGKIKITFTAYDPYGYIMVPYTVKTWGDVFEYIWNEVHDYDWRDLLGQFDVDMFEESGLLDEKDMPAEPTTSSRSFQAYNAGTQNCGLNISISGSTSHPIRFYNQTNGTECIIKSLPQNKTLIVDADTGKVTANTGQYAYVHHDHGFLSLNPGMLERHISYTVDSVSGSEYTLLLDYDFFEDGDWSGRTIRIGTGNYVVSRASAKTHKVIVSSSTSIPSSGECIAFYLNDIVIQEQSGSNWVTPYTLSMASIQVSCRPRVS